MAKKARSGGAITAAEKKARAKNRRIRAAASAEVGGRSVARGALGGAVGKALRRRTGRAVTPAEVRKYLKSISPRSSTASRLMKDILSEVAGATKKAIKARSGGALTAAEKKARAKNRAIKARSGAAVTKKEKKRYKKR
jgi:hypothetical protein|tara:strand:+ start:782 stop:1198 length:417 start_codon:yes stop_codon:yes gene_type:complete